MTPTTNTKQHNQDKTSLRFLIWDTFTGICCYFVFTVVFAGVYCLIGYGLGHMIFYAFNTTLMMPISFHECLIWGLIPGINILCGMIAAYIIMWKFLLLVAWKVFVWLLGVLPGWLDAWAKNIKR